MLCCAEGAHVLVFGHRLMAIDGHVRSSDQFQNGYKLVDFLSFFHDDGFFVWFIFYEALTRVYGDGAN